MRVGVLGPLLVVDGSGAALTITGGRPRALLAALAVRANQIVTVDELAELVWDGAPPAGATRSIRVYVTRLRQALTPDLAERLVTQGPGYVWRADTDLQEFEELCRRGAEATRDGEWETAADVLARALALWRGTPLVDVPSELLREREVPRLERLRLHAVEDRVEADLQRGGDRHLVPELRELVERHPLRERLHAQLMRALAAAGEQAEALEAYQRARRTLRDELGVEPGPELRALHEQVLAGSVDQRAVPRQLPADVLNFTGRQHELRTLTTLLDAAAEGAVVISAIDGTAGVGKTALAIHWGRRVADRFPDGQLYVNLRGYDLEQPVSAGDALAGFLRALGLPGAQIPVDTAERAVRYRSLMAGRRMLVVADNAGSVDQVRPLLPGAPGSVLLVTSRDRLAGLVARDGARRVNLDTLSETESATLLRTLIGPRVDEEPAAAAQLADLCARLPLALRVVAELAVSRPKVPLARLAEELADRQRRLDLLDADGDPLTSVRAVFSWSYQQLDADQARMFRLMGLHPGADADVHAAAALADTTPAAARELLDALAAAHLVIQVPPDRYGMHDLLRAYAVELATERDEALTRLYDHYLHAAATAMDTVFPAERDNRPSLPKPATGPVLDDPDLARAWLDSERANFVAVSAQADVGHASGLATVLFRYLDVGGHGVESLALYGNAARAAARAGDRTAEAAALISIASAHRRLGRPDEAATVLRRALDLLRETGDVLGQARVWANLGMIESQYRRRYDVAIEHFTAALPLYRQVGARTMEGFVLNSLGDAEMNRDRYPQAVAYFDQSLAVFRELDYSIGEASVLDGFGELAVRQGDHRTAVGFYERSLALFHAAGDRSGESYSRHGLAKARHGMGDLAEAHADYAAALALFVQTGDRLEEGRALAGLAETAEALGRDDAGERWRAALEIFEELDAPEAARVRDHLAEV